MKLPQMFQCPITGKTDTAFRRTYPLLLAPLVCLVAALIFPLPPAIKSATLPQEPELTNRVLVRLETAEAKEPDPWMRDDIRIAWITTLYASQGNPQPHVDATYRVLGLHPLKVWPAILARRKALLGKEFVEPTGAIPLTALPQSAPVPKKPCASTRRERKAA